MTVAKLSDGVKIHFPPGTSEEYKDATVKKFIASKGAVESMNALGEVLDKVVTALQEIVATSKAQQAEIVSAIETASKSIATSNQSSVDSIKGELSKLADLGDKMLNGVSLTLEQNKEANKIRAKAVKLIESENK